MKRECGKEESIPEREGGPERSRAEEDRRGVERKEKRSRAEGEKTLSYITPIAVVSVSDIITYQIAAVPICGISGNSNAVILVYGIFGIQIAAICRITLVNSLTCKLNNFLFHTHYFGLKLHFFPYPMCKVLTYHFCY